jgi:hypothetical protein
MLLYFDLVPVVFLSLHLILLPHFVLTMVVPIRYDNYMVEVVR